MKYSLVTTTYGNIDNVMSLTFFQKFFKASKTSIFYSICATVLFLVFITQIIYSI